MTYQILRNGQQFGPYSLADLQRYVASGEILLDDLALSEGMQQWVPVSQIIGNLAASAPPAFPPQSYGQVPLYGAPGVTGSSLEAVRYPLPPNLHWALVLLLSIVTCGLFQLIWMFIEAAFAGRIDRDNKTLLFYSVGLSCSMAGAVIKNLRVVSDINVLGVSLYFGGLIVIMIGHYKLKDALESHFNTVEPIHLQLSGGMTFFFNTVYFQYHLNRIHKWRRTGVLS